MFIEFSIRAFKTLPKIKLQMNAMLLMNFPAEHLSKIIFRKLLITK